MPMTVGPSASGVILRVLAGIALVVALFSIALRFIFPVVMILILVVLLGGSVGRLIVGLAVRVASAPFRLLGMHRRAIRPRAVAEGLGFRIQVGSDQTFVQLRGGVGRITANDSVIIFGRRTFQGVLKAYFVHNRTDGSWIVAKGVLFGCAATAFLLWIALGWVLR
jgi:hypothetical protein